MSLTAQYLLHTYLAHPFPSTLNPRKFTLHNQSKINIIYVLSSVNQLLLVDEILSLD